MTTTQLLATGPATADLVMSTLSPQAQTIINARRKDHSDRKSVGALAIRRS